MGIELHNITKTFGTFTALKSLSLTIPDGELVALLGPSGSGKTTLLRIVAGLDTFDPRPESSILFHSQDVTRTAAGDRGVGFVFQHYALFRHMTVFENIAFGLRVRRGAHRPSRQQIADKVRELVHLIQLDGMEYRYPAQLSGGQRQRVALARALAIEPKVLLLDEPFGALDAKVRRGLRRWLRRLHDEIHVTSVFVTHDQEEALEVADRVVVMNHGAIEQAGTPESVFHRPANAFVMDFLGSVNLFHGRIEEGKAVFGSLVVDPPQGVRTNGNTAQLFVRPYDLELHCCKPLDSQAMRAKVMHIQLAGPVVRVELLNDREEPVQAEIPHDRFRQAPVAPGDDVFVTLRESKVFVADYCI